MDILQNHVICQKIFNEAKKFEGTKEWAVGSNPQVEEMYKMAVGVKHTDDVPWCAAYVGFVLALCGLNGTNSLMARSYEKWGVPVSLEDAQQGDIVVFYRKGRDSGFGHVGFYCSHDENGIRVLGGNQDNSVSEKTYPVDKLVAVRRARPPRQSVKETKTAKAGVAVAAGSSVALATEINQVKELIPLLSGNAQTLTTFLLLGLIVAGLFVTFNRKRDFDAGSR